MEENKTEEKPKNAGRVAWGKKLALVSKQLKEAKNKEIKLIKTDIQIDKETKQTLDYHLFIGFGGFAVALIALYLQYKKQPQEINPVHVIKPQPNPFDF